MEEWKKEGGGGVGFMDALGAAPTPQHPHPILLS